MTTAKAFKALVVCGALGLAAMATADIGPFSTVHMLPTASISQSAVSSSQHTVQLEIFNGTDKIDGILENDVRRIRLKKMTARATISHTEGKVRFLVNGIGAAVEHAGTGTDRDLDLSSFENLSPVNLQAEYRAKDSKQIVRSNTIRVRVDTAGPLLSHVEPVVKDSKTLLRVYFRDNDIEVGNIDNDPFELRSIDATTGAVKDPAISITSANFEDGVAKLELQKNLGVGFYRLEAKSTLKDKLDNPAGQIDSSTPSIQQLLEFRVRATVSEDKKKATIFPEFVARKNPRRDVVFNPGDHVETRVVRTYYIRDAFKVVRIVNRDIEAINKAGVDKKARFARDARNQAEEARSRRERLEREAIERSREERQLRQDRQNAVNRLAQAQQELQRARAIAVQLKQLSSKPTIESKVSGPITIKVDDATITGVKLVGASVRNAVIVDGTTIGGITKVGEGTIDGSSIVGGSTEKTSSSNVVTTGGEIGGESLLARAIASGGQLTNGSTTMGTIREATFERGTIRDGVLSEGTLDANTRSLGGVAQGGVTTGSINSSTNTITNGNTTGATVNGATVVGSSITTATVSNTSIEFARIRDVTFVKPNPDKAIADRLKQELRLITQSDDLGGVGSESTDDDEADEELTDAVLNGFQKRILAANADIKRIDSDIVAANKAKSLAESARLEAERAEQLASRDQFEAEVAAALEDPDIYKAAELDSIDRIRQVSITVIGEGLIQLRGPIGGINDIRKMINQIDSPLGQVKVGIFTVQINGEHGDKMEKVAADIEGHIDLSRTLTNHSLAYLRRAIQEVAGQVVSQVDHGYSNHRQSDRDRKYLYSFFGTDFINELYDMDSEFIHSENKLISLHAMDTVSQSQAMFILALAKNDIRQHILQRFMHYVENELPQAEWDFRQASGLLPKRLNTQKEVWQNANTKYRFQNFRNFFTADVMSPNAMTPMQREFIRLSQVFKSRLVAEQELKQRLISRSLIQEFADDSPQTRKIAKGLHLNAKELLKQANASRQRQLLIVGSELQQALDATYYNVKRVLTQNEKELDRLGVQSFSKYLSLGGLASRIDQSEEFRIVAGQSLLTVTLEKRDKVQAKAAREPIGAAPIECPKYLSNQVPSKDKGKLAKSLFRTVRISIQHSSGTLLNNDVDPNDSIPAIPEWEAIVDELLAYAEQSAGVLDFFRFTNSAADQYNLEKCFIKAVREEKKTRGREFYYDIDNLVRLCKIIWQFKTIVAKLEKRSDEFLETAAKLYDLFNKHTTSISDTDYRVILQLLSQLQGIVNENIKDPDECAITEALEKLRFELSRSQAQFLLAENTEVNARVDLDHRQMLDFLIDEQEEKFIELIEGARQHISQVDNYLKRQAIALEDDFKLQFYDPAFAGVRAAGRDWAVNLGQIERTTILTNNRTFAKVSPQATMEFDLPKRAPVIVEGMNFARAVMQDYGSLVNDPTFVGLASAFSGQPVTGGAGTGALPSIENVIPDADGTKTDQVITTNRFNARRDQRQETALEGLIPDPAIYKFQTGTGFEIRPVIQPDGHSVIYDFNYLYTTNVREPVDPDEKHLGRVKQHFIHTQVQTSSFGRLADIKLH